MSHDDKIWRYLRVDLHSGEQDVIHDTITGPEWNSGALFFFLTEDFSEEDILNLLQGTAPYARRIAEGTRVHGPNARDMNQDAEDALNELEDIIDGRHGEAL